MSCTMLVVLLLWLLTVNVAYTEDVVQMKIVDEVSNYGWNALSGPDSSRSKLKPKVEAQTFRGPEHLKVLLGKCYTYLEEDYKYEFCPFKNVTQHERSMRWNPYSGILGIWKDWDISNNSFVSMNFDNGDSCGDSSRQVKVFLACGLMNNITSVEEPERCHYKLNFATPLACHEDSLLVYPVLNASLQIEWDKISQSFHDKYITFKGYKRLTQLLFVKAGFVLASTAKLKKSEPQSFISLDTCNSEYAKLFHQLQDDSSNKLKK